MIDKEELAICRRRGHDAGILSVPNKWSQCRWCGTWLRTVKIIEERDDDPPEAEQSSLDKYR